MKTNAMETTLPALEVPKSSSTVTIRVIDTTVRLNMPVGTMFDPPIKGHDQLSSPSFSFLIENEQLGRKVLFDLGVQRDWEEMAPSVVEMIKEEGWDVRVEKDVAEILTQNGVLLESIEAIIWSHYHWDHLGDPSTFPTSTDIVVGPGFNEEFLPEGQPIEDSPILPKYYKQRNLREISAKDFDLKFGSFPAFDYFGDGGFFLLDSPGHAIGHLCGLARTTSNPETFILMGGDIASHAGEFRPSQYYSLPESISPNPLNPSSTMPCPGHIFKKIHRQKTCNSPFYGIGTWSDGESTADDLPAALESNRKLQLVDAHEAQVFVVLAHDESVGDVIDFFPKTANRWKELGWGRETRWMFLADFRDAINET